MLHPAAERGEHPKWSRYVKKVSVEEAGSLPHLVHVWAAIVRHADMFTSSRAAFTPQMVQNLQRLGASPHPAAPPHKGFDEDLSALFQQLLSLALPSEICSPSIP